MMTESINPCPAILELRVFLQGFYLQNDSLIPTLYLLGASTDPTAADSITVELRDVSFPDNVIAVSSGLLHSNGHATLSYTPSIINGSYYIVVNSRNGVQTWSKDPFLFDSESMSFDFTRP